MALRELLNLPEELYNFSDLGEKLGGLKETAISKIKSFTRYGDPEGIGRDMRVVNGLFALITFSLAGDWYSKLPEISKNYAPYFAAMIPLWIYWGADSLAGAIRNRDMPMGTYAYEKCSYALEKIRGFFHGKSE